MRVVRRAVIPAAGHGTRMRPFSLVAPKELVPLGAKPALLWVLEEAAKSGIEEIGLVTRPGKEMLQELLAEIGDAWPVRDLRFETILQEEPKGLAEALALCEGFARDEPFALLLPDNVIFERAPSLASMLRLAEGSGRDVVGVMRVDASRSGQFADCGRIDFRERDDGVLELDRLHGKKRRLLEVAPGESILRTCGRYVCQPHLFEFIERLRPEVEGEYSEVPVYQRIIAERGAFGRVIDGTLFDVGHPAGVLAASAHLAACLETAS